MNEERDWDSKALESDLLEIQTLVQMITKQYRGNSEALLALLRSLESLHREIREDMFEPSLPDTRQDLFHLLRNIEETGGWPYIERMKLQNFLRNLSLDVVKESQTEGLGK